MKGFPQLKKFVPLLPRGSGGLRDALCTWAYHSKDKKCKTSIPLPETLPQLWGAARRTGFSPRRTNSLFKLSHSASSRCSWQKGERRQRPAFSPPAHRPVPPALLTRNAPGRKQTRPKPRGAPVTAGGSAKTPGGSVPNDREDT